MRKQAFIGLGSNLGDREYYLQQALSEMERASIHILGCSNVYETLPVGFEDQGPFLNMVAFVETVLAPEATLQTLLSIENTLGRIRIVRWGPRTIDLDLLTYDNLVFQSDRLTLPHPFMNERLFVLIPLVELCKNMGLDNERLWEEQMQALSGKEGITLWKKENGREEFEHFGS